MTTTDLISCCGEDSSVRTTTKIQIYVTDENINAPNFDIYFGEDNVQKLSDIWIQSDTLGKVASVSQIQDLDSTLPNTRTCFNIIDDNGDGLKAADYFDAISTKLNDKVFKTELKLRTKFENDITNEDDQRDADGDHYNFRFQFKVPNIVFAIIINFL